MKSLFFLTRMSNIVSSLVSIIIPFSGLFLVSKKCIFWSSFESDFWKDRKFSGKNYLIISFKMEVSCGQPKQGFYLFWNVRFSGCSSFETWLLDIFSMCHEKIDLNQVKQVFSSIFPWSNSPQYHFTYKNRNTAFGYSILHWYKMYTTKTFYMIIRQPVCLHVLYGMCSLILFF